jgi:hypothetical protein
MNSALANFIPEFLAELNPPFFLYKYFILESLLVSSLAISEVLSVDPSSAMMQSQLVKF